MIESHCCGNYVFEEVGNGVWRAQELPCLIHSCPEDCRAWMELVNGTNQQQRQPKDRRSSICNATKKMEMVTEMTTVENSEPLHVYTDESEHEHEHAPMVDTTHCCHYNDHHHERVRKSFQRRSRRVNFMLLPLSSLCQLLVVVGRRRKQSSIFTTDETEKPTATTARMEECEIRTQATDIEDRESLVAFQHVSRTTTTNNVVSNGKRSNKKASRRKHRLAEI